MIRLTTPSVGEPEARAAAEVIGERSLAAGRRVAAFENGMAEYVGRRFAVACSSGTAALHVAMLTLDVGPGDEVIVPDYGALRVAHAVELCGATPIFVDVEADTYTVSPAAIESALTERTRAIVPVHTFGLSADMKPIVGLARRHGVLTVEDASDALSASCRGLRVGSFGDLVCVDLGPQGLITTGKGGLVLTDDPELSAKARSLSEHGLEIVDGRYQCLCPGLDCRMAEPQAVIGSVQLGKLGQLIESRIRLAKRYNSQLADIAGIRPPTKPDGFRHVYQSYVAQVEDGIDRSKLMLDLRAEGVETDFGTHALHLTTHYREKYDLHDEQFPVAAEIFKRSLALPLYPDLGEDAVSEVCAALRRCLQQPTIDNPLALVPRADARSRARQPAPS